MKSLIGNQQRANTQKAKKRVLENGKNGNGKMAACSGSWQKAIALTLTDDAMQSPLHTDVCASVCV